MELFEPERFTKIIEMAAKGKDIKDEMGIELYTTLNQVMGDITNESQDKMNEAVKQIRETKIISNEELCNEIFKLQERFLIEKSSQVRSDPRIVSAFSGKEELLYKGIDFTISSMFNSGAGSNIPLFPIPGFC